MSLRGRLWPSLSTLCSHLARGGQRIQKDVYNTKGYYIRGEGALSVLLCFFLGLPTSLLHAGERFHWTELQLWGPAASEAFLCKEPYNKQPPPPVLVKCGLTSLVVKLFFFAYWSQSKSCKKKLFPEVMTKLTGHLLVSFLSNLLTGTLTDNSADIMRVCVCVIMTQTSGRTVPTVLIQAWT